MLRMLVVVMNVGIAFASLALTKRRKSFVTIISLYLPTVRAAGGSGQWLKNADLAVKEKLMVFSLDILFRAY